MSVLPAKSSLADLLELKLKPTPTGIDKRKDSDVRQLTAEEEQIWPGCLQCCMQRPDICEVAAVDAHEFVSRFHHVAFEYNSGALVPFLDGTIVFDSIDQPGP